MSDNTESVSSMRDKRKVVKKKSIKKINLFDDSVDHPTQKIIIKKGKKRIVDNDISDSSDKTDVSIKLYDNNENNKQLNDYDKNMLEKNAAVNDVLRIIDKFLELYPQHRKDRSNIIDYILDKPVKKPASYILEKVQFNGKPAYYRDPYGNLVNENVELVGLSVKTKTEYCYFLFDDLEEDKNILINNKKKIIDLEKS